MRHSVKRLIKSLLNRIFHTSGEQLSLPVSRSQVLTRNDSEDKKENNPGE
jgi:hypothetical protein